MIKCWHCRRIISRSADENAPLPPPAQTHIAECPGCRRHCDMEHDIVRRLSATRSPHPPSPFLHTRIMAQIAASPRDARQAAGLTLLPRPGTLAAAMFIVLTTILLWPSRPATKPSPGKITLVQLTHKVETVASTDWTNTAVLPDWATNPDKPLQTEMQAILHDARGAMTALADNFFPEELRQTLLKETSARN